MSTAAAPDASSGTAPVRHAEGLSFSYRGPRGAATVRCSSRAEYKGAFKDISMRALVAIDASQMDYDTTALEGPPPAEHVRASIRDAASAASAFLNGAYGFRAGIDIRLGYGRLGGPHRVCLHMITMAFATEADRARFRNSLETRLQVADVDGYFMCDRVIDDDFFGVIVWPETYTVQADEIISHLVHSTRMTAAANLVCPCNARDAPPRAWE